MAESRDCRKLGFQHDAFSENGLLSRRRWRYFETVLLADLHDPSYVRLALGRRGSLWGRLARLKKELLEPARTQNRPRRQSLWARYCQQKDPRGTVIGPSPWRFDYASAWSQRPYGAYSYRTELSPD
jgi:hypothetical protein